jgi:sugar phosphate isomerase/epimerase
MRAIRDIGFSGFANLETDAHPNLLEADMRKNLAYIRNVMARS